VERHHALIMWDWDYYRVAQWLGHDNVEVLRAHYAVEDRLHQQVYGGDLAYRASYGRPAEGLHICRCGKTPASVAVFSGNGHAPAGIRTRGPSLKGWDV
jgi:hypothetical protein